MLKYIEMAFEPFLLLCSAVLVIICLSKKFEEGLAAVLEFGSAMTAVLDFVSAIISGVVRLILASFA